MKLKLLALAALTAVTTTSFAIDIADRNDLIALEKRVDALSASHSSVLAKQAEREEAASQPAPRPTTPDWVLNVPESDRAIFAVGIGVSNNVQRSIDKAVLNAERRLIEVMNSEIETATRSTSIETGDDVQETYESLTRKNAYGQLIGTQRVKTYQVIDGNKYRTYVMMGLPMDENNPIRKQREARQVKLDAETRNRLSYDSLDKQLKERQERDRQEAERRQQNIRPLTPAPLRSEVPAEQSLAPGEVILRPIPDNTVKEVSVIDMSTQQKQELVNKVEDENVKQRIAGALEKPNAVVLSTTIR